MESYDDIKKMLDIQHREQKRTGNGIFGRATKTGKYTKKMVSPVDRVHGWDKRRYKGYVGRVKTYNMWENEIMPYEKFLKEPVEKQAALLAIYDEKFRRKDLMDVWGIDHNVLSRKWIKPFGLKKGKGGRRPKNKSSYKASETANTKLVPATKNEEVAATLAYAEQDVQDMITSYKELNKPVEDEYSKVDTSGFSLKYDATVTGRTAAMKLAKLAYLLEDDDNEYEVQVKIREKGE